MPFGAGTLKEPIDIKFLPGKHQFTSPKSLRRIWYISNTSDYTFTPKPCGILIEGAKYMHIHGGVRGEGKTIIMMDGPERMVNVINHLSEDISFEYLVFDLKRPSVSEITVLQASAEDAVIQVAEGSAYEIKNGKFEWTGDLGYGWMMAQEADLETRKSKRLDQWSPFDAAIASNIGNGKVRLTYAKKNCVLEKGKIVWLSAYPP